MTETDWLTAIDVVPMLEFLKPDARFRKTRLLKCAYCRFAWHLLVQPASRRGVEVMELFADGDATVGELAVAMRGTRYAFARVKPRGGSSLDDPIHASVLAADAADATTSNTRLFALGIAQAISGAISCEAESAVTHRRYTKEGKVAYDAAKSYALAALAELTRCVVGNPFRPVVFDPRWCSEAAVALATGIYADRAFDRLPVLADALEEAGCDHPDVLAHCRGPSPHARGCWVVDLMLGKE